MKKAVFTLFALLTSALVWAGPCDEPVRYNVNGGKFTISVRRIESTEFSREGAYRLSIQCHRGAHCAQQFGLGVPHTDVPIYNGSISNDAFHIEFAHGNIRLNSRSRLSQLNAPQGRFHISEEPISGCAGRKTLSIVGVQGTTAKIIPNATLPNPVPAAQPSGNKTGS